MSDTEEHGPTATNGGQQPPKPVTIAFVLYPGFTALDIVRALRGACLRPRS